MVTKEGTMMTEDEHLFNKLYDELTNAVGFETLDQFVQVVHRLQWCKLLQCLNIVERGFDTDNNR